MEKSSQSLGSNPATSDAVGATNMPLNQVAETGEGGVTTEELKDFLKKMIRYGDEDKDNLATELGEIRDRVANPDIKEKLRVLGNALVHNSDKTKASRDPDTGEKMPGPEKIAKGIIDLLDNISSNRSSKTVYNNRLAQTKVEKKKKKTRGNPFRVLMGKVGKLLDHGVEKRDIVRYLAKLKYWNNETIERAVDIVRDYNKKKERKEQDTEETEKTSSSNSKIVTSALDYDRKPQFEKRSTGELIYRACFLMDVMESNKFTKQGDFKDTDKKGAKEELKAIKAALVDRGVDKEELSNIGLGD